jgi:predicted nucleotidyltransferase component of viral defense system
MINKQDILDRATEWQLRPEIVEKDYVLGWLLSAIAIHPITKNLWIFKGGTSIKKCYFETYRFSEDLDFSLLPSAPYTENDLRQIFDQITDSVSNLSGITIDQKLTVIDPCRNKAGQTTFMARIYYQGPLGKARAPYKIKFDITNNELIVEPPIRRKIIHSYPDSLTENEGILCYAPDELLAEKTRAL